MGRALWGADLVGHDLPSARPRFEGEAPSFERYIETIHPDDRETFRHAVDQTVASGDTFGLEFRILWPDGSVHWTHAVGRIFRDNDGRPTRLIGTATDITEQHRLEEDRDRLLADERRAGAFREAFIDVISHELRTPITTIFGLTRILARPGRVDDATETSRTHRRHRGRIGAVVPPGGGSARADAGRAGPVRGRGRTARAAPAAGPRRRSRAGEVARPGDQDGDRP